MAADDDDGVVIDFPQKRKPGRPRKYPKPPTNDDEQAEADQELLTAFRKKELAESALTVGKATIFNETTDMLAQANARFTDWKTKKGRKK